MAAKSGRNNKQKIKTSISSFSRPEKGPTKSGATVSLKKEV